MNALTLYKFLTDNSVECSWRDECLYAWLLPYDVQEFSEMVESYISDEPLECHLVSSGYLCIDLVPVCEYYGIEPEEMHKKED